jgi:hypothetical protein
MKHTLGILLSNLALVACNMSADAQEADRGDRGGGPVTQRSFDLAGSTRSGSPVPPTCS